MKALIMGPEIPPLLPWVSGYEGWKLHIAIPLPSLTMERAYVNFLLRNRPASASMRS